MAHKILSEADRILMQRLHAACAPVAKAGSEASETIASAKPHPDEVQSAFDFRNEAEPQRDAIITPVPTKESNKA